MQVFINAHEHGYWKLAEIRVLQNTVALSALTADKNVHFCQKMCCFELMMIKCKWLTLFVHQIKIFTVCICKYFWTYVLVLDKLILCAATVY